MADGVALHARGSRGEWSGLACVLSGRLPGPFGFRRSEASSEVPPEDEQEGLDHRHGWGRGVDSRRQEQWQSLRVCPALLLRKRDSHVAVGGRPRAAGHRGLRRSYGRRCFLPLLFQCFHASRDRAKNVSNSRRGALRTDLHNAHAQHRLAQQAGRAKDVGLEEVCWRWQRLRREWRADDADLQKCAD
ncbi:unnamed protein product [Polarella glacialis]|uniref:Uncharacterized protein n=1 Tax=Polarella glacialis TaxID=89957 RepID=A0A813LVQ1_POLGL|nr:unnamed protein product [Polarella glacialis]